MSVMAPTPENHPDRARSSAPVSAAASTPAAASAPVPASVLDHPAPHGHGLRLRIWDAESDAEVAQWIRGRSDPDFLRWNTPGRTDTDLSGARLALLGQLRSAKDGRSAPFCVTDAVTGTVLGAISVNMIDRFQRTARVGYWVLPEARGQRVATRALALASRWAFTELELHRLELGHALGHDASCRVARNCGFAYEGTLRDAMFAAGRNDAFRDMHLHARLATDPEPAADPQDRARQSGTTARPAPGGPAE